MHLTRRRFAQGLAATAAVGTLGRAGAQPTNRETAHAHSGLQELASKIREREISSVELTQYLIDRIEKRDEALNAVVVRNFERALDAARAADEALAAGRDLGPLHGIPMTVKESFDVTGLETTWGIPAAAGKNVATGDAVVVERLQQAGAHILGKTNVPLLLADTQSYNAIYGTTNNPWNVERTPGGSSGGAGAALAAGFTPLEAGSDIGGSIRNPAHFCGVYGHKPTWGVVPMRGHTPPGAAAVPQDADLAVVGPLARSAEDLAFAFELLAGPDILHSPGWKLDLPAPRAASLSELRIAVWPTDEVAPVSDEMAGRVLDVADRLAKLGAKVSDTARPSFDPAHHQKTYMALLNAIVGTMPATNIGYRVWMAEHAQRGALRVAWQEFFDEWDLVLCPSSATEGFPHDQSPIFSRTLAIDDRRVPYFQQIFWAGLATLCYLPSTVFPTGPSSSGMPIGLQAIGPAYGDRTTLEFARLVAEPLGGFTPPPDYAAE
ncbi:MAG: amidase family protein [Acidobacteriota bacterium]